MEGGGFGASYRDKKHRPFVDPAFYLNCYPAKQKNKLNG